MNYYEHHLGDYLRDTAHLSILEDGVYRRLLDAYYIREAPLPLPPREVYRLVRAASPKDREAVDTVLREFFDETPEGWRHSRCDREIARFQDKQRKAKASADARWSQSGRNANASPGFVAIKMRTHSEGNALQTPDTRPIASPPPSVSGPSKPKASKRCPPEFLVDAELQRWARTDCPLVDIRAETAAFRDCEFPKAHADWPATWRGWMRREQKRLAEKRPQSGAVTDVGFGLETLAERAKRERIAELTGGLASRQPTHPPGPLLPAFAPPETFHAIAHDER